MHYYELGGSMVFVIGKSEASFEVSRNCNGNPAICFKEGNTELITKKIKKEAIEIWNNSSCKDV